MADRKCLKRLMPACYRLCLAAVVTSLHGALCIPATSLAAEPPTRLDTGKISPATPPADAPAADPFTLTPSLGTQAGSELLLFQDMPIVVSAARQAQPINLSGVPVSIITADDIHYGGWTRITGLYALDAANHHILRLSAAKAFRAPLVGVRRIEGQRFPVPPPAPAGTSAFNFLENQSLENEQVYALEAGYSAQVADGLTFRLDGFYQRYLDLIGASPTAISPMGTYSTYFDNLGDADSYGGETELSYTRKNLKLSVWYGYEYFQTDVRETSTRSLYPAEQKAGATARWSPGDGWTLTANYRYTGRTDNQGSNEYEPSFNNLDLSLAKSLFDTKAEILLGVQDVFDETGFPLPQTGQLTSHESPGRTFFVRLQGRF